VDLGLTGRAALITGGGRGIGAAVARELAREGCDVAVVDLDAFDSAEAVVRDIRGTGRRAMALRADVISLSAAEATVETVVREFGRLDLLICNAGITRDAMIWNLTEEAWDRVLAVNLKGTFAYCRAAAPVFRAQHSGRIVTVASINGLRGKVGQANYAASKAGMVALTKTVARELGPAGVTVNCVAPGMVQTGMADQVPPEIRERALAETAVGRIAEPEDVAGIVAFLCSGRARHLTGTVIKVDGGQYM